jgi:hypothetical protein
MEPLVLAHVGQISRHQADTSRAKIACGGGEVPEAQGLRIGIAQRGDHDHVAVLHGVIQANVGFAVGEAARLDAS